MVDLMRFLMGDCVRGLLIRREAATTRRRWLSGLRGRGEERADGIEHEGRGIMYEPYSGCSKSSHRRLTVSSFLIANATPKSNPTASRWIATQREALQLDPR